MQSYCDHGERDPADFSFYVRYQISCKSNEDICWWNIRTDGRSSTVQAVGHEAILYCVLNLNQVTKKTRVPWRKRNSLFFFSLELNKVYDLGLLHWSGFSLWPPTCCKLGWTRKEMCTLLQNSKKEQQMAIKVQPCLWKNSCDSVCNKVSERSV